MITIEVDEGYAYDYLSILDVKWHKNLNNAGSTFNNCFNHISSQVGWQLHDKIFNSKEYKELYKSNLETFSAVEKARYGEISAKDVDDLNMKRYNCKINLQKTFFPKEKISETKT
jgi:hypothetical protein